MKTWPATPSAKKNTNINTLSLDAYAPSEMARRVETVGVQKANQDPWVTFGLSVLAGGFISLGAAFATMVTADTGLSFSLTKLLGGVVFSLGLILVVVAGAELFTGNNLIVMAWASRKVSTGRLLRNWGVVYVGNFIGALITVGLIYFSQAWSDDQFLVGANALKIAQAKVGLGFVEALTLGILCNALVCLAVWLCYSARTTSDKILSILFPITAFVALGFEHSVANMYFIPMGLLLQHVPEVATIAQPSLGELSVIGFLKNLIPVTIGNVIGGSLMVAGIYWWIYLRQEGGNT